MRKVIAIVGAVAFVAGAGWLGRGYMRDLAYRAQQPMLPVAVERSQVPSPTEQPVATSTEQAPEAAPTSTRPTSFNLVVPFTTQAPFADWSQPYQDACEEAALLTVVHYWKDEPFTPEVAKEEILDLVAFQNQLLGAPDAYRSTDASTTAYVAKQKWPGATVSVVYDWTVDDIESEVAAGRPVVVFAHGKELGNPNFRNGGPDYHALVVKGYTEDSFITNDVGTRRGADYVYPKQTLLDASHDWNNGDVPNGRRAMLVLTPK